MKTGGIICKIYSLSTYNFNLIHSAMIPFLLSLSTLHVQSKLPKQLHFEMNIVKILQNKKQYKQGSFHPISWWYAPLRSVNCSWGLCKVVVLTAHGKTAGMLTTFVQTTVLITLTIVLSYIYGRNVNISSKYFKREGYSVAVAYWSEHDRSTEILSCVGFSQWNFLGVVSS